MRVLVALSAMLTLTALAWAQQLPMTCEEQLARLQGRFDLVNISREQGETLAGAELGALRRKTADLEARVKAQEAELTKLKPAPPEKAATTTETN